MARFFVFSSSPTVLESGAAGGFAAAATVISPGRVDVVNGDGSIIRVIGTGLVWNASLGQFTGGTVTALRHFAGGTLVDRIESLSLAAADVQAAFEQAADADAAAAFFLSGDDTLDARQRPVDPLHPLDLTGCAGADLIYGSAGADEIRAGLGDDTVYGGQGDDLIYGGGGDDLLQGGGGNDRMIGDWDSDQLIGGSGDDVLYGEAGNDTYLGGQGNDTAVYTRSIRDLIITKTADGFQIIEPNGIDTLKGMDVLATDEGRFVYDSDTKRWTRVDDTPGLLLLYPNTDIRGNSSGESITITAPNKNIVLAMGGNDTVTGSDRLDLLLGGAGNDQIFGDPDETHGTNDRLYGDDGSDTLWGRAGNDIMYGGSGNDTLAGGSGDDDLTGGTGADQFVFYQIAGQGKSAEPESDVIHDFEIGVDLIDLQSGTGAGATLTQTAEGALITLADGDTILLRDVDGTGHTLDDFLA